ncbi:hypothetical protein E2542_SST10058 [Spatholobus suberectus]|nr:hypothetical protein E2542_SST10058 [Spatholobus suberectus]
MEFNESCWGPKWKIRFKTFVEYINGDVVTLDDMAGIDSMVVRRVGKRSRKWGERVEEILMFVSEMINEDGDGWEEMRVWGAGVSEMSELL